MRGRRLVTKDNSTRVAFFKNILSCPSRVRFSLPLCHLSIHPFELEITFVEISASVKKATVAAKAAQKGVHTKSIRKIRTSATFRRPKTLRLKRTPKYPRRVVEKTPALDAHSIIIHPLSTEAATRKMENNNTLTFICDLRANKHQIRNAVKALYDVPILKVRTLVSMTGQKKAYVRLEKGTEAMDVAGRIGLI